uniref:Uncharacterized protein n=1 Tax=Varanus komodoensis TaxID=61221 RepID=A0A8D2LLL7_VARKO
QPPELLCRPWKLREEKPRLYRIWDTSQKFFYLVDNMLVANPQNSIKLKGKISPSLLAMLTRG